MFLYSQRILCYGIYNIDLKKDFSWVKEIYLISNSFINNISLLAIRKNNCIIDQSNYETFIYVTKYLEASFNYLYLLEEH